MKKHFNWFAMIFIIASMIFMGCQQEVEIINDTTAPAEVSGFNVTVKGNTASLTWTNPTDKDLAGIQISMNPAEGLLANPISLGASVTSFVVSNLQDEKSYEFTVKTFDTKFNYSEGVKKQITILVDKEEDPTPNPDNPTPGDTTPPAQVENLVATNKDASVLLTWEDATDKDVYGYEVTWNKSNPINRSAAMTANSMMVAPGAEGCYISNLTNGTEYTFTVKSVDTSGNKSVGVSKTITPSIIEKSPLEITLTPSTTEKTNQNVVISVNVTTDNASEVKKIAYKEGILADIESVLSGTDISTTKEITATKNTTYTVAVVDTAGRRELAFITINNIDKEAPAQVGNIIASYSRNSKRIDLSWTNPADEDFAGIVITYGKTDSEEVKTIEPAKDKTSVVIENIADDDSEYTISIATKDDVGNVGTEKTVTVIAATGAKVTNISLDRIHLDSIMTNREIKVTVSGSNFDLLTSLLVQVTDGSKNEAPVVAVIDAEKNTATATVTAPIPSSPTDSGTTYTVKAIIDSTTPSEVTTSFVVSKPADVTSITLSETQIKVGTAEYVTATITGKNFDIRGETQVKLFDANDAEVTSSTVTVPLEANISDTEFTVEIPVPIKEGVNTVAVYFDDVKDNTIITLQVYGVPQITKVSIPTAGVGYGGSTLPVTIEGKNFTAPRITASSFSGSGAGFTNFVVISDTKATAEVTCPYVAGETTVTVNCAEASGTATLKVLETAKSYTDADIGKIVLEDGSIVTKEDYDSSTMKAIAVVVGTKYAGGQVLGVGLQKSSGLMWAPSGTKGYGRKFKNIICTPSETGGGTASTATFAGDIDGSDNWAYICSIDPEGTKDAATNYPAFDYANNYGITQGITGNYKDGWYIPSLKELCDIYKIKDTISDVITTVGGNLSMSINYWSSSQCSSGDYVTYVAYGVGFSYGDVFNYSKSNFYDVLVLQAFNAE